MVGLKECVNTRCFKEVKNEPLIQRHWLGQFITNSPVSSLSYGADEIHNEVSGLLPLVIWSSFSIKHPTHTKILMLMRLNCFSLASCVSMVWLWVNPLLGSWLSMDSSSAWVWSINYFSLRLQLFLLKLFLIKSVYICEEQSHSNKKI